MARQKITLLNFLGIKAIDKNFQDLYTQVATAQAAAVAAQAEVDSLGQIFEASVTLTNTQLLALRATPITLIAAPGAGFVLKVVSGQAFFDYTAAYTESAANIAVRYENGSGVSIFVFESTGFVTATADTMVQGDSITAAITAKTGCDNKALVLHNNGAGELGGGNAANTITFRVLYRVIPVGW